MRSCSLPLPNSPATYALGVALGNTLSAGDVVLLEGDLGSGKTTLVQGIGQGLNIGETIDSPTFTLINEYLTGRVPLYHFDLYRLQPEDVLTLYPETYWEAEEVEPGIVAIEWAERLPYKPPTYLNIQLLHQPDGSRAAQLIAVGDIDLQALQLQSFAIE